MGHGDLGLPDQRGGRTAGDSDHGFGLVGKWVRDRPTSPPGGCRATCPRSRPGCRFTAATRNWRTASVRARGWASSGAGSSPTGAALTGGGRALSRVLIAELRRRGERSSRSTTSRCRCGCSRSPPRRVRRRPTTACLPGSGRRAGSIRRSRPEFGRYAGYLARFGDLVEFWTQINEPMVVAIWRLPVAFRTGTGSRPARSRSRRCWPRCRAWSRQTLPPTTRSMQHGTRRRAGQNMIAFRLPIRPAGQTCAGRSTPTGCSAAHVPRRGCRQGGLHRRQLPLGGRVTGLDAPVATDIPLLDFVAATAYRTGTRPG